MKTPLPTITAALLLALGHASAAIPANTCAACLAAAGQGNTAGQSLQQLIDGLRAASMKDDSSRLYQKRLLTLLPMIRDGENVNLTLPETKGNTALHYAVALGSVEITGWLLKHGAKPYAFTDKGASVLQCVGAKNGPAIRNMIFCAAQDALKADLEKAMAAVAPVGDKAAADEAASEVDMIIHGLEYDMTPIVHNGADARKYLGERKDLPLDRFLALCDAVKALDRKLRAADYYGSADLKEKMEWLLSNIENFQEPLAAQ